MSMTRDEYAKFTQGIFKAARKLAENTPESKLNYSPKSGTMSVSQILKHLTSCLGAALSMAIHNSWPKMSESEMLPSAEKLPRVETVAEALKAMDQDWEIMNQELKNLNDSEFSTQTIRVPWMPVPMTIMELSLQNTEHLSNHRMQLFIWLKLSGEAVNTHHLYGIG